jgi:hypothetical protein
VPLLTPRTSHTTAAAAAETYLFRHVLGKTLWVFLQPAFYALRPIAVLPKRMTQAEAAGWAIQVRRAGCDPAVCFPCLPLSGCCRASRRT